MNKQNLTVSTFVKNTCYFINTAINLIKQVVHFFIGLTNSFLAAFNTCLAGSVSVIDMFIIKSIIIVVCETETAYESYTNLCTQVTNTPVCTEALFKSSSWRVT